MLRDRQNYTIRNFRKRLIIFENQNFSQWFEINNSYVHSNDTDNMKISSLAVLFLSTVAIVDAKSLRERATLATDKDASAEDAVVGLEGAAKAARYEASFLEAVANRDDLDAKTKALIQAAAASAKYEASILEQAAIGNDSAKERLLKDKTLPNGGMCAYWWVL